MPGAQQIYVEGNGITSVAQNHSPNSLLSVDGEKGEASITVLPDGAPESMSMIRDLSTFIMETASEGDRQKISNLLGNFAGKALGNQDVQGGVKDLLSDEDGLATLLAYILKYMDTYEVDAADINELLRTLGINLDELISDASYEAARNMISLVAQQIGNVKLI